MLRSSAVHEQKLLIAQNYSEQLVIFIYTKIYTLAIGLLFHLNTPDCACTSICLSFSAVTCGPAPVPENAIIIYDFQRVSGENVPLGGKGTYKCLRPMALIGNPRTECTIYGNWTEPPVCRSKKLQWYKKAESSQAFQPPQLLHSTLKLLKPKHAYYLCMFLVLAYKSCLATF